MAGKEKTQLEYALSSIDDALRKYKARGFLGLSDNQIGHYFIEAKQDALAVDVNSVNDTVGLEEFTKKQQELLIAIRNLSKK